MKLSFTRSRPYHGGMAHLLTLLAALLMLACSAPEGPTPAFDDQPVDRPNPRQTSDEGQGTADSSITPRDVGTEGLGGAAPQDPPVEDPEAPPEELEPEPEPEPTPEPEPDCTEGLLACDHYHAIGWLDSAFPEPACQGLPLIPGNAEGAASHAYRTGDTVCFWDGVTTWDQPPVRVLTVWSPFGGRAWCNVSTTPGGFECGAVDDVQTCGTWAVWYLAAGEKDPTQYAPRRCPG